MLRLQRLLDLTRALGTASAPESYLQTLMSAARDLTDSAQASLLEFNEADGSLHFVAAPSEFRDALRGTQVPVDGSAAGRVYRDGEPLQIQDLKADARYFSALDFALAFETRSLLAVPLLVRGKPIGVLEAVNKRKAHYTEEDVTILVTLAALAAAAWHAAGLQRRADASFSELTDLDRLKNDFIAITSHELRTPLGVILGHATFLRELMDEQYQEQVDVIIKNASRLKEIIESLGDMDSHETGGSRLHAGAVSMTQVIQDVVAAFSDMASSRNITLKARLGGEALNVEGDESKISVALSNLVKNAIMFTDDGGHVLILGQSLPGYVKVSVVDDGIGIPAEDLPRIFERFYQVESHLTRRHGGMGLGLSVAKVMIDMHAGRIWAESSVGGGSTFSFLLPLKADTAGMHAPASGLSSPGISG